jgi:hypothetical protein
MDMVYRRTDEMSLAQSARIPSDGDSDIEVSVDEGWQTRGNSLAAVDV